MKYVESRLFSLIQDKRYSQEMGNFASALHWFSEVQPDFWHTAREARRFMDHVIQEGLHCQHPPRHKNLLGWAWQEKVTFPGFIIQNELPGPIFCVL